MIRAKRKKTKMTRGQAKILDKKYFGEEPTFSKLTEMSNIDMINALNWYNYMIVRSDGVEFLYDYYKTRNMKKYAALKKVDEKYISLTYCWSARMIDRGEMVPSYVNDKIDNHVDELIKKYTTSTKNSEEVVVQFSDKTKERESNIIGDIEEMLDNGMETSVYDYLTKNSIPKSYCSKIVEYYQKIIPELEEAIAGKNLDVKEAYKTYKKSELRKILDMYNSIIDDCDRYAENKKAVRKPRAKKKISIDKKIQNVKYLERFDEFQLVSKDPSVIIGSKILWLYDARYKNVIKVESNGNSFDIKGTTILNYDEEKSIGKSVGRKGKEITTELMKESKIGLNKIMLNLKGNGFKFGGRINKNMLILRAF